jgi:hypothetical protein
MFIRTRAHTCQYCCTADEAHYQRHKEIAERIRVIYDCCKVTDWTIKPPEATLGGGLIRDDDARLADRDEIDRDSVSKNIPSSRRQKKDAKALTRAAKRPQFITHDDILYVEGVMHRADANSVGDQNGPSSTEEMEEIARNLKYNAHVYNSQGSARELRMFAEIPDAHVDFDSEMKRILEVFRITELLKRNTRNRGLRGKDLKAFQIHVEEIKKFITNDLVLVKRDDLETRMRRAGYLRYTNKTAHSIVEDRYIDMDRRTGGKLKQSPPEEPSVPPK